MSSLRNRRRASPSPLSRPMEASRSKSPTRSSPRFTPQATEEPEKAPTPTEDKWKKWWRRMWTGLALVGGFFAFLHTTRTLGIVALIMFAQAMIYKELVKLALNHNKERQMPGFGWFYAYWFVVAVIFLYGRTLKHVFLAHNLGPATYWVINNYHLISYTLWIVGLIAFVLSLRSRKNFAYQFSQFGYCHIAILVVVAQSTFLAANVFHGFIWFVVPCGMVVCNDTFAYFAGFFFGRTRLIKLSPNKTWEGFIGGFIATCIWSFWFTRLLHADSLIHFYVCPHKDFSYATDMCDLSDPSMAMYKLVPISTFFGSYAAWVPALLDVQCSTMMIHAVVMSVFASFVAPFAGFFASGFKRAFKIKDFGDLLPGHGGITDRLDCQIVMGSFAYLYQYAAAPSNTIAYLVAAVCAMSAADQAEFHAALAAACGGGACAAE